MDECDGEGEAANTLCILDCRTEASFGQGPWLSVTGTRMCCNIPTTELKSRSYELPAKFSRLVLVASTSEDAAQAAGVIGDSWKIIQTVIAPATNRDCDDDDDDENPHKWVAVRPLPSDLRAWSPSPFLDKHIVSIMQLLRGSSSSSRAAPMLAIDVGSGSGRDVAFLSSFGFSTIALDNRKPFLDKCVALSTREIAKTSAKALPATPVLAHLSSSLPFRDSCADLILCIRFLERPLLPNLCRKLAVGGVLVYSHFVDGVQHSKKGTPKSEKHFVLHGELKSKCVVEASRPRDHRRRQRVDDPKKGDGDDDGDDAGDGDGVGGDGGDGGDWLQVLVDEEATLADGRPVANLIVRRVK